MKNFAYLCVKIIDYSSPLKSICMWILTMDVNAHDQHGEYFVAGFDQKPSFETLKTILGEHENDKNINRILNGEAPCRPRDIWYLLREMKSGEVSSFIVFI